MKSLKPSAYRLLGLLFSLITLSAAGQSDEFELMVLGTSQDAGYPQIGCTKVCCENITTPEPVASMAIISQGKYWIIDATPDFTLQYNMLLKQYPDSKLGGIFLTHAHIGHYTGLMYLGREAMNADSVPVFCLPKMEVFLRNHQPWKQLVDLGNIKLVSLNANEAIALTPKTSITPLLVPHRDEISETCGYLLASKDKKALYIPDIDKWDQWKMSIIDWVNMVDIALLDATFYDENDLPNRDMNEIPHPFVIESLEKFEGLPPPSLGKVYFTHFNHTNPLLRSESEASMQVEEAGFNIARTGIKL